MRERPSIRVALATSLAIGTALSGGAATFAGGCPGDLDGNGVVDGADIGAVLGAFGTDDPIGDANGDGTVDGADLGLVLGGWGECPPVEQTNCFWASATLALTLGTDDGELETLETELGFAFAPICLRLAPGPHAEGELVPASIDDLRLQGLLPDPKGDEDARVDLTLGLLDGEPAVGTVLAETVDADGNVVIGRLELAARLVLSAHAPAFESGLATLEIPAILVATVDLTSSLVAPRIMLLPAAPAVPLFSVVDGSVRGFLDGLNIRPEEESEPEGIHECVPKLECEIGCPDGVQASIVRTVATGTGNDSRGTFGAKIRFTFNPGGRYCADFLWTIESDESDGDCGLRPGDVSLGEMRRNAKCTPADRRIVIDFEPELVAGSVEPECGCAHVSTFSLYCRPKNSEFPHVPIYTAEIKWERLANGNAKVTVTPIPGAPIESTEIPLPTGIPCP